MNKGALFAGLILLLGTVSARAEDGVPNHSTLSQMGLSSMKVVSDTEGEQVRGEGIGILSVRFLSIAGTSSALLHGGFISGPASPANGNVGTVDPITGLSVPVAVSFTSTQPGQTLFISSVSQGSVFGTAN